MDASHALKHPTQDSLSIKAVRVKEVYCIGFSGRNSELCALLIDGVLVDKGTDVYGIVVLPIGKWVQGEIPIWSEKSIGYATLDTSHRALLYDSSRNMMLMENDAGEQTWRLVDLDELYFKDVWEIRWGWRYTD